MTRIKVGLNVTYRPSAGAVGLGLRCTHEGGKRCGDVLRKLRMLNILNILSS